MDYKKVIEELNEMEAAGVIGKYAIGGAVATTFYPVEATRTEDIDIFVVLKTGAGHPLEPLREIFSYLRGKGYVVDALGYAVIGGWKVQFLPPTSPLDEEALAESVEHQLDGLPTRVFSLEHLTAIALKVGRPKDKERIIEFRKSASLDVQRLSEILTRHQLMERWEKFNRFIDG